MSTKRVPRSSAAVAAGATVVAAAAADMAAVVGADGIVIRSRSAAKKLFGLASWAQREPDADCPCTN
jgi:hypothetical protein